MCKLDIVRMRNSSKSSISDRMYEGNYYALLNKTTSSCICRSQDLSSQDLSEVNFIITTVYLNHERSFYYHFDISNKKNRGYHDLRATDGSLTTGDQLNNRYCQSGA